MDKNEIFKQRNEPIYKSNDLVQRARYDLQSTRTQSLKLLEYVLSKLNTTKDINKGIRLNTREFCEICGMDDKQQNNIKDITKALAILKGTQFEMLTKDDDGSMTYKHFVWIVSDEIPVEDDLETVKDTFTVRVNPHLAPYLLDVAAPNSVRIREGFVSYSLSTILNFSGKYSINIYQLLKSYHNLNEPVVFAVKDFREKLGVQASAYKNFKDFRLKVLEPSVNEINLYSDIVVSCQTPREGRAVKTIIFEVRDKTIEENLAVKELEEQLKSEPRPKGRRKLPDAETVKKVLEVTDL